MTHGDGKHVHWTLKRINAALSAINAMLAGPEHEGDWPPEVDAKDLEGARARLMRMRDRWPKKL